MTHENEDFTETRGPDYQPGNPVLFVFLENRVHGLVTDVEQRFERLLVKSKHFIKKR